MPLAKSTSISWVTLPWRKGSEAVSSLPPTSLVKLIVEILQPFRGKILDPACGSGGMFVQSDQFTRNHRENSTDLISVYGTEQVTGDDPALQNEPRRARTGRRYTTSEQLLRRSASVRGQI